MYHPFHLGGHSAGDRWKPHGGRQPAGSYVAFACSPLLPSRLAVSAFIFAREYTLDFLRGLRELALEFSGQGQAEEASRYLDFLIISFFRLHVAQLAPQIAGASMYYTLMQLWGRKREGAVCLCFECEMSPIDSCIWTRDPSCWWCLGRSQNL